MNGIPADVAEAARAMLAAIEQQDWVFLGEDRSDLRSVLIDGFVDLAALATAAIMVERKRCMGIAATSMQRSLAEMDKHVAETRETNSPVHASIIVGYTFAGNEAKTIADAIERGDQP